MQKALAALLLSANCAVAVKCTWGLPADGGANAAKGCSPPMPSETEVLANCGTEIPKCIFSFNGCETNTSTCVQRELNGQNTCVPQDAADCDIIRCQGALAPVFIGALACGFGGMAGEEACNEIDIDTTSMDAVIDAKISELGCDPVTTDESPASALGASALALVLMGFALN